MALKIIMVLAGICDRALLVIAAQQEELKRLGCNREALESWTREANHLRDLLRKSQ